MESSEQVWSSVRGYARGYLRRFADPWTRSHCEDLVQETAVTAWHWAEGLQDPRCLWAAVRTIARRLRVRALSDLQRELEAAQACAALRDDDGADRCFRIAGRRLSMRQLLPCIQRALRRLRPEDQRLLLDFHAGFCCAELAARSGHSESAVKTRIHRARRRVQREIEACVRAADDLDVSVDHNEGEQR